jgi:uncharacterized protein
LIRSFLLLAALLLAALPCAAADQPAFPALTGRVVDEAGVLPAPLAARLTRELAAHEQRTGQQVVVAVVKSLNGRSIEEYGVDLGRAWGIGQKGSNTGAILLVAPSERKVRIEVGYGLEGDLTDAASATIIDQAILPRFRQGDIPGGIVAGTEDILRILGDDVTAPAPPRIAPRPQASSGHGSIGSIVFILAIFAVFVFFAGRRGGGGSAILPFILFSSLGGRGGSSFGSGGDGGGFSGGGGSFGGGGASGSW